MIPGLKRIEGEHSTQQDVAAINPGFPQPGHTDNCGSCAVAYELRHQGYDVEARPGVSMFIEELADMFDGATVKNAATLSTTDAPLEMASKVGSDIQKWGEGARGAITGLWVDIDDAAHLFSFNVRNGATTFDDGQIGEMDVKHLEKMIPQTIQYVRLDNLIPNDKVKNAVKNKGMRL